jgi:hypothetical protein
MRDTDTTVMVTITNTSISDRIGTTGVTGMYDGKVENRVRLLTVAMTDTGKMITRINSMVDESQ